eukprot:CAMPEP_0119333918 /NCGR_PEP_ID=MMETSP1333-20130426/86265_1 /TAXON_ID=418940 /ORGANISM="Scyphosphaera apsteinii, Strain RCC1455" /LENGTH=105 /DNA_ID=CAMNT_0007344097 /DNA_START=185 /DNA_END=499 /DNA_ORIENTATION=-
MVKPMVIDNGVPAHEFIVAIGTGCMGGGVGGGVCDGGGSGDVRGGAKGWGGSERGSQGVTLRGGGSGPLMTCAPACSSKEEDQAELMAGQGSTSRRVPVVVSRRV